MSLLKKVLFKMYSKTCPNNIKMKRQSKPKISQGSDLDWKLLILNQL